MAPSPAVKNYVSQPVRFVVLHLVCDDFDEEAALSCIAQQGPSGLFQLVICDDSETKAGRAQVDAFCAAHPGTRLLRRPARDGFKAGNVNHALRTLDIERSTWVVIADADEMLAPDHLWELACFVDDLPESTAFVQGLSDRRLDSATPFQQLLSVEIPWCYRTCLQSRETYGFLPFLGHAGAFRASAWLALGGMPVVVSEDYAFAIEARRAGMHGVVWPRSSSHENYPPDFRSLHRRLCKFSAGTAELVRTVFPGSRQERPLALSTPERIDLAMQLGVYFLNLAALGNLFLTGWLASRVTEETPLMIAAPLPYVFLAFILFPFATLSAGARNPFEMLRYWAAANAVYLSLIPSSVVAFMVALFKRPRFDPTGATSRQGAHGRLSFLAALLLTPALGVLTLACALCWPSPFQWVMAGFGISFLLFPVWVGLHRHGLTGRLCRLLCFIPVTCFIAAMIDLWRNCWH